MNTYLGTAGLDESEVHQFVYRLGDAVLANLDDRSKVMPETAEEADAAARDGTLRARTLRRSVVARFRLAAARC